MLGNCYLKKTVTINNYKSINQQIESLNTDKDMRAVTKNKRMDMILKQIASKIDLSSSIKERKNYSIKSSRRQIATIVANYNQVQPRKNVHLFKSLKCFKKNLKSLHPLQLKPIAIRKKLHSSEHNKVETCLQ